MQWKDLDIDALLLLHSVYLLFWLIARSITQTCPPGRQGRDYTSHHTLRTPTPGWREDDYKSYPMSHPINSHLEPPNCFDIKPIEYISSPWRPTRDIPPRPRDFTSSSTRWRSRKPTVILPDWSNFSLDASTWPARWENEIFLPVDLYLTLEMISLYLTEGPIETWTDLHLDLTTMHLTQLRRLTRHQWAHT